MNRVDVEALYVQPLKDLLLKAAAIHAGQFSQNKINLARLLSIKTGGCPENCAYCPQSAHYKTGVKRTPLATLTEVRAAAESAKTMGATRFCMGAAWREVREGPEFERVLEMVREVKKLGLEVCCTLGLLNEEQARRLKEAGLYAYNHNIDTSRAHYAHLITTRTFDDRLRTIAHVRSAGLTVCTGGILGLGETDEDRIDFLLELASLSPHPESVTINVLIPIPNTPLEDQPAPSPLVVARMIATARCLMPQSVIRLSAGRSNLSQEAQFLCFLAGANSIFIGDRLLTSANPNLDSDQEFLRSVGMSAYSTELS